MLWHGGDGSTYWVLGTEAGDDSDGCDKLLCVFRNGGGWGKILVFRGKTADQAAVDAIGGPVDGEGFGWSGKQISAGGPIVNAEVRRLDHPLQCIRAGHAGETRSSSGSVYHGSSEEL
jgi:hypothetical protein